MCDFGESGFLTTRRPCTPEKPQHAFKRAPWYGLADKHVSQHAAFVWFGWVQLDVDSVWCVMYGLTSWLIKMFPNLQTWSSNRSDQDPKVLQNPLRTYSHHQHAFKRALWYGLAYKQVSQRSDPQFTKTAMEGDWPIFAPCVLVQPTRMHLNSHQWDHLHICAFVYLCICALVFCVFVYLFVVCLCIFYGNFVFAYFCVFVYLYFYCLPDLRECI